MTNLEQLYASMSDQNIINEVTKQIEEIYEDPSSISEVFQILSETKNNDYVRTQAAIQLKFPLKKHWKMISETPASEEVKSSILQILSNEPSMYIRDNMFPAISIIIGQQNQWPQLLPYVRELFESKKNIQTETALKILFIWIPTFDDSDFSSFLPELGENIVNSLSIESLDIQIACFNLFKQMISRFTSPLESPFSDILERIFAVFKELMIQENDKLFEVSRIIEDIATANNGSIEQSLFFSNLLEMALDEKISPEYYFQILSPLTIFTYRNNSDLYELKPYVEDIIKITILCVSKSLNDECFTNPEEDSRASITVLFDQLIHCMNNDKLYVMTESFLSEENANDAFATIVIYNRFLIYSRSQIAVKHSAEIVKKLLKYMNAECHHTLFEVALSTMSVLIDDVEDVDEFNDQITKACLEALETKHLRLIIHGLDLLTMLIDNSGFNNQFLEILITKITEIISSEDVDEDVLMSSITVLSALIVRTQKDIIPFVQMFLPIIVQAAQISEQSHPKIKGIALVTLAQIISVAPDEASSIIEPSMQMFKECSQSEDPALIEKLLDSFSFLASAKFDGIESVLPFFIEFAINQLDLESMQKVIFAEDFDPEEEDEMNINVSDTIVNALSVIGRAVESAPEIFAKYAEDVAHKALNFTAYPSQYIVEAGLSVLSKIIVTYSFDPNEYINELLTKDNIFENFDEMCVTYMFIFCNDILKANLSVADEFMEEIFKRSLEAIEHKLPFFDYLNADLKGDKKEEEDDDDDEADSNFDEDVNEHSQFSVMESVFKLLTTLVQNYTQFFNTKMVARFIDSIKRAQKKKLELELNYATDILGQLFEADKSVFNTSLLLKFTIKIIVENLDLCDGTFHPFPYIALRRIILAEPTLLDSALPHIIERVNAVFELDNEGQSFYSETISAVVSFLFALLLQKGPQFPFDTYLPPMFASLPSKYYANFIYESLMKSFTQEKEVFVQHSKEIIRILSQTLSLNDKALKGYNFTEDIYANLLKMLIALIQSVPGSQELISQFVPEQSDQEVLQERLSSVSNEE